MIPKPSLELYQNVRGAFITKGLTLHEFCKKNKINTPSARQALIGSWNGPKGKNIRQKICQAAFKED